MTADLSAAPQIPDSSDRGISPIAGRFGAGRGGKLATVAAVGAAAGVFMLATARHPQARPTLPLPPARQVVPFEPAPSLAHPDPGAPQLSPPPGPPAAGGPGTPGAPGAPVPPAATAATSGPEPATLAARSAPMVAFAAPPPALPATPALSTPQATAGVPLARASRLPDRRFLILAGSTLPCVLQTALDSTTPGFVSCLIPSDVYSEDGTVVLLEKGTRVTGEYRGDLKAGQARLFVLWTRAVTPGGVAVALASPAADPMGRAGVDGTLDSHFWQRFGGAALLSVIDGGFAVAGRAASGVNLQLPSTAPAAALQGGAAIAPTLRKPAGAEVVILAAQDFDFSGVYGVAAR